MSANLSSIEHYKALVQDYDTFLFDCDGVIWRGATLIPGIKETIEYLKSLGKQLIYVTNNSSVSRKDYVLKFKKLGIEAKENEIFGSAYATAVYMKHVVKFPTDKKVFIVGGSGIADELELLDVSVYRKDLHPPKQLSDINEINSDPEIGAVIVGIDFQINYSKLAFAHVNLTLNEDCIFVATNDDATFPFEDKLFPGCGSILSSLITSTGHKPTIIGKPHKTMFDCVEASHEIVRDRTLMIGDRLDTDIKFGIDAGIDTLLVFTGVTNQEKLNGSTVQPKFTIASFGNLSDLV